MLRKIFRIFGSDEPPSWRLIVAGLTALSA